MRLYFKHLLRTIPKRPLQPVILALSILLSVAVSALSLGLGDALREEQTLGQAASYGEADITVRLGAGADTRFLFASEAEAVLGEEATVLSLYELPLLLGERAVSGAASELARYGELFPLSFTAYGEITEAALSRVVLVSHSLAEEAGLRVGDSITLTLMNREQNFTIAGITADRFVGEHDILFDITAITRRIAEGSIFLSALGDSFRPAGALYIALEDGQEVGDAIARLAAAPALRDATLLDVAHHVATITATEITSVIVNVIILFTGLLSAAVTFSSFVILASERREENAVFLAAGARAGVMALFQYLEVLLYFAVAAPLGLGIAAPALGLLVRLAGLSYAEGRLGASAMGISSGIVLVTLLLTVLLFQLSHKRRRGKKTAQRPLFLVPLCPLVLLLVTAPFLPGRLHFGAGIAATVLLFLSAVTVTPPLVRVLGGRRARRATKSPTKLYAAANTRSVPTLRNMTALVAILLAIVLTSLSVVACSEGFLVGVRTLFAGEYAIPGATERAAEEVSACPSVERTSRVYLATADFGDRSYTAVAASDPAALADHLSIPRLPEGDEIFLSRELAVQYSLSVGDPLTVTVEGKPLTLTVGEILPTGLTLVLLDAPAHGIPYNMLLAEGRAGASEEQLLQELTEATASELTGILPTKALLQMKAATFEAYNRSAILLLLVTALFSVIGLLNNLLESYRDRREEFSLYALSGMTAGMIRRMKARELLTTLGLGTLIALLTFAAAVPVMQYTLSGTNEYLINIGKFLTER